MNAAALAKTATVSNPRSNQAKTSAVAQPHTAGIMLAVEKNMAGKVIAPSTAYGI